MGGPRVDFYFDGRLCYLVHWGLLSLWGDEIAGFQHCLLTLCLNVDLFEEDYIPIILGYIRLDSCTTYLFSHKISNNSMFHHGGLRLRVRLQRCSDDKWGVLAAVGNGDGQVVCNSANRWVATQQTTTDVVDLRKVGTNSGENAQLFFLFG